MLKQYYIPTLLLLVSVNAIAQERATSLFPADSAGKENLKQSVFNTAMAQSSILPRDIEISGQPGEGESIRLVVMPYSYGTKQALSDALVMMRTANDSRIRASLVQVDGKVVFTLRKADFPVQIVGRHGSSQDIPLTLTEPKNYEVRLYFEPLKDKGQGHYFGR